MAAGCLHSEAGSSETPRAAPTSGPSAAAASTDLANADPGVEAGARVAIPSASAAGGNLEAPASGANATSGDHEPPASSADAASSDLEPSTTSAGAVGRLELLPESPAERLAPSEIQRVVRKNYGRFRICYERGLHGCPNLEGKIVIDFVIGLDGTVTSAKNGGSDVSDSEVVQCVIQSMYGLTFPKPQGGEVRVRYPIMFSPG